MAGCPDRVVRVAAGRRGRPPAVTLHPVIVRAVSESNNIWCRTVTITTGHNGVPATLLISPHAAQQLQREEAGQAVDQAVGRNRRQLCGVEETGRSSRQWWRVATGASPCDRWTMLQPVCRTGPLIPPYRPALYSRYKYIICTPSGPTAGRTLRTSLLPPGLENPSLGLHYCSVLLCTTLALILCSRRSAALQFKEALHFTRLAMLRILLKERFAQGPAGQHHTTTILFRPVNGFSICTRRKTM